MKTDRENIVQVQEYLATLKAHLTVLVEHTRGDDNTAATRALELAELIADVITNEQRRTAL